jgi:hypothetical protein
MKHQSFLSEVAPFNLIPYQAHRHTKELKHEGFELFCYSFLVPLSTFVLPVYGSFSLMVNPVNVIFGLEVKIPVPARATASLGANVRQWNCH